MWEKNPQCFQRHLEKNSFLTHEVVMEAQNAPWNHVQRGGVAI